VTPSNYLEVLFDSQTPPQHNATNIKAVLKADLLHQLDIMRVGIAQVLGLPVNIPVGLKAREGDG